MKTRKMHILFGVPHLVALLLFVSTSASAHETKHVPRLVVSLRSGSRRAADMHLEDILTRARISSTRIVPMQMASMYVAEFDSMTTMQYAQLILREHHGTEMVVPDFYMWRYKDVALTPKTGIDGDGDWYMKKIGMSEERWRFEPPKPPKPPKPNTTQPMRMAIVDSGIKINHPAFSGISTKVMEIPSSYDVQDIVGHGTKIAGIVAHVFSTVPSSSPRIMVLKVTQDVFGSKDPPYAFADVVRAIDYGYFAGARIFSMSFGNDASRDMRVEYRPSLDNAAAAYKALFIKYPRALFVAAAGNEATDLDSTWGENGYTYSPCMVDVPNLLCVGATDEHDSLEWTGSLHSVALQMSRSSGSNYGYTSVDMAAPGVRMRVPTLDDKYTLASGTSYAAPLVAAVATMISTNCGVRSPSSLKNIIMTSGDFIAGSVHDTVSHRRLNASRAYMIACQHPW